MYSLMYRWMEKNLLPDFLIRFGIRNFLKQRLKEECVANDESQRESFMTWVKDLAQSPIALEEESANNQHYEVPAEFFQLCLGKHLKYSSGFWPTEKTSLAESEVAMLELYCQRAEIQNGQNILDLGCGWGSLSLYLAEKYPQANIVGFSNSDGQRLFIEKQAAERKLSNLKIVTGNIKNHEMDETFDRIISIEMFEHMRSYKKLLEKISHWLKPDGSLFVHIFCHREFSYPFEVKDETDWMSKYFFTGGMMPSEDLLLFFQDHMKIREHWRVNGTHYQKTSEAWLKKLDEKREIVLAMFSQSYGKEEALKKYVYWRVFFMSCAELFGYRQGKEWFVSHYLFEKSNVNENLNATEKEEEYDYQKI